MSVDYDNRERLLATKLEDSFKTLGSYLAAEAMLIHELVIAAYRTDLIELDAKSRILDDVVAIANIGDADTAPEDKYRKIRAALVGKGLISND